MAISLTTVENEIKSRARPIGVFTASDSITRMRYAILRAAQWLANMRDWDYLHDTEALTTVAGDLGPYTPPSSMVRFAVLRQVSHWGFITKDVLAPILATDSVIYRPYMKIEDGQIYFFADPGNGSLTLNFLAEVADSIEDADLTEALAIIPDGLKPALVDYSLGDLWGDLPRGAEQVVQKQNTARSHAEEFWHQSTLAQAQRGIAPRGVNKMSIDNHAQAITVLGMNFNNWIGHDS